MKHCELKSVNTSSYIQHWKQQLTVFSAKKPRPHSKQNPCDVKGMNVLTFGRICKGRRSRISSIVFSSSSLNQWNRPNVSPDDRENVQLALRDRVHPECPGPERTGRIRFRKSKPDWRTSHTQVNPFKRFSVIATSPLLHQCSSSALFLSRKTTASDFAANSWTTLLLSYWENGIAFQCWVYEWLIGFCPKPQRSD